MNTMTTMSEHCNSMTCKQLGKKKLEFFKKLIEGSKASISTNVDEEACAADEELRRCHHRSCYPTTSAPSNPPRSSCS